MCRLRCTQKAIASDNYALVTVQASNILQHSTWYAKFAATRLPPKQRECLHTHLSTYGRNWCAFSTTVRMHAQCIVPDSDSVLRKLLRTHITDRWRCTKTPHAVCSWQVIRLLSLIHEMQCLQQPLIALYELSKVERCNCLFLQPLLEPIHNCCNVPFASPTGGKKILHTTRILRSCKQHPKTTEYFANVHAIACWCKQHGYSQGEVQSQ